MSDHPQEIVALAQAIGVAVQIQPSTLGKENEEAASDLIAGFIDPLIARERASAMAEVAGRFYTESREGLWSEWSVYEKLLDYAKEAEAKAEGASDG